MTVPVENRTNTIQVVDEIFARIQRPTIVAPVPRRQPSPIEEEWTEEEKQSVVAFTRQQMDLLRKQQSTLEHQRAEVLRRQQELNEACLLRQQELNRQIKELTVRRSKLEERETDISRQESTVAVELQRVARAKQDLQQFRIETAEQEAFLAELKNEAQRLLENELSQRRELAELEASLRVRWTQIETDRSEIARDRADLERIAEEQCQRQEALDRREEIVKLAVSQEHVAQLCQQAEVAQVRIDQLQSREVALQQRVAKLEALLSQRERESNEKEKRLQAQQQQLDRAERDLQAREQRIEEMLAGLMEAVSAQSCQRPTPNPSAMRLM